MPMLEEHAQANAEQYRGCTKCNESHHESAFCPVCGCCYFQGKVVNNTLCTLVQCICGLFAIWD